MSGARKLRNAGNKPISICSPEVVVVCSDPAISRVGRDYLLPWVSESRHAGFPSVQYQPQWREGVYDAKSAGADLLAFTLDKTSGEFSPTTRYRDYAITRNLIHWESQSTTRADSAMGLRYQQHVARGRSILLFARNRADDRAFWFLGPATYVSHEGEKPMAITWKLHTPLPGDLFASFAAAVT